MSYRGPIQGLASSLPLLMDLKTSHPRFNRFSYLLLLLEYRSFCHVPSSPLQNVLSVSEFFSVSRIFSFYFSLLQKNRVSPCGIKPPPQCCGHICLLQNLALFIFPLPFSIFTLPLGSTLSANKHAQISKFKGQSYWEHLLK